MGTRHLVCVYSNKRFQVAQYGQYDGYPSGTGADVLSFLHMLSDKEFKTFKKKLRNVRLHPEAEFRDKDLYNIHPQPTASEVLNEIFASDKEIHLINNASFGGDSLFCEWAYVINMDTNTFDVYEGFVKDVHESAPLFLKYKRPPKEKPKNSKHQIDDYYPVKLAASYGLECLPDIEDFLERFNDQEDED